MYVPRVVAGPLHDAISGQVAVHPIGSNPRVGDFFFQYFDDLVGLSKRGHKVDDPEGRAAGKVRIFQRFFLNGVPTLGFGAEAGEGHKPAWETVLPENVVLVQPKRRFKGIEHLPEGAWPVCIGQRCKIEHGAEICVFFGRDIKPVIWKRFAQNKPQPIYALILIAYNQK